MAAEIARSRQTGMHSSEAEYGFSGLFVGSAMSSRAGETDFARGTLQPWLIRCDH